MPKGLPKTVKKCIEKSQDSALLAVETYNKPAIKFKSGGYIVLMTIAWTALFHSIFFKQKKKPFHKESNGRFVIRDGDYYYWELKECLNKYFGSDTNNPIRKNLEFFIPLRNMIEHKSIPEIDSDIFAECQSLLLNFDKIMEKEFGVKYCIRESLSFALQLYPSSKSLNNAIIENPSTKSIVDFIKSYRSSISADILDTGEYSFKAFLIQVANHQSKNSLPIQFVPYDKLNEIQKSGVNRVAALVKNKFIQVPVSNKDKIKPNDVVKKVQAALGNPKIIKNGKEKEKFNMDTHTRCWKKYNIRPNKGALKPEMTDPTYCIYDEANENYLYTDDWVDFLVDEMAKDDIYSSLY
ncbi:MAG: DUF3644 domain-containing protein [Bacteroidota bacterium]